MPARKESDWDEAVILDQEHLMDFTGQDVALVKEILSIFLANAPVYLEQLAKSKGSGWRPSAHKLKGAARGIGAWNLARAAERAELMAEPHMGSEKRQRIVIDLAQRLRNLVIIIKKSGYIKQPQ